MDGFEWNDARDTRLKELWPTSLPTNAIARDLGCKNGKVTSRAKHLGLPADRGAKTISLHSGGTPKALENLSSGSRRESFDQHEQAFAAIATEASTDRKGLCQWPIGDPAQADFHYCPEKAEARFCAQHTQDAHAIEPRPLIQNSRQLRTFGGA